jgi:hypothetical protein
MNFTVDAGRTGMVDRTVTTDALNRGSSRLEPVIKFVERLAEIAPVVRKSLVDVLGVDDFSQPDSMFGQASDNGSQQRWARGALHKFRKTDSVV